MRAAAEIPAPFPVEHSRTTPHGLRIDIQLLRALAIILVLVHHARFSFVPGGFLGVDIFFVVSGYLMSGIIGRELDERRFSFAGFYARRVRRLLPAAYATLAVTALIAPWLLDGHEYRDFIAQLGGSFAFVVNLVLWKQTDYFNTSAALKPLLHMWSLSIEEQFYIVLPFTLFLCPARFRLPLTIVLTLASGALCAWFLQRSPSATFYFLPFRAWELGLGTVTALAVRRGLLREASMPVPRLLCAAILIAVPLMVDERGHPGIPALIVCLATAVLMIPGANLKPSAPLSPLVAIGNRSYSLYLVHWPVYAFANNIFIGPAPVALNTALLIPCLLWMEVQYRLVEQRFRTMAVTRRTVGLLVLIPLCILGASLAWQRSGGSPVAIDRSENVGLNPSCILKGDFVPRPECRSTPHPHTLVWGDSFAMHLVGGMAESTPGGVAQATQIVCGPFLGIAPTNGAQYSHDWAEGCSRFNNSVIAWLAKNQDIDTVVLSSALNQYVPGAEQLGWEMLVSDGSGERVVPQSNMLLLDGLRRTVAALHAQGKRVVLVAPPPSLDFDIARCDARLLEHRPTVGRSNGCGFLASSYHRYRRPVLDFLAMVKQQNIVPILSFDDFLCGKGYCKTHVGGAPVYRDGGHISIEGSKALGRAMRLGETARAMAR